MTIDADPDITAITESVKALAAAIELGLARAHRNKCIQIMLEKAPFFLSADEAEDYAARSLAAVNKLAPAPAGQS